MLLDLGGKDQCPYGSQFASEMLPFWLRPLLVPYSGDDPLHLRFVANWPFYACGPWLCSRVLHTRRHASPHCAWARGKWTGGTPTASGVATSVGVLLLSLWLLGVAVAHKAGSLAFIGPGHQGLPKTCAAVGWGARSYFMIKPDTRHVPPPSPRAAPRMSLSWL